MAEEKVEYAVLEVSAHALALKKTSPILFDAAAFTNLSQDHLDFFGDMDSYAAAKKSLFTPQKCKAAAVNFDDALGKQIIAAGSVETVSYSAETDAGVAAVNISLGGNLSFTLKHNGNSVRIKTRLYGRFNMYNCLAAAATCVALGVDLKTIAAGLSSMPPVTGRFNVIDGGKYKFIIDYAHTPDGINNVLTSARELCRGRLICVFGCGGNRDKSKRKIMGAVASELADFCVITSDNPRFENPMDIISEIEQGICGNNYVVMENRKKAIAYAAYSAKEGDVIAVLGKGGERYQEIAGVKYPYDDYEVVKGLIEG
jgi:UDP-N-acetylmuramoyl-L-alanyl-D-glutamate--2,6-diaminopimelate ligase